MAWFGKPKRVTIPRVPTDRVVPAHVLDNDRTTRSIIMGYAFRFNQVLDCDKLHTALSRLLEIGEWRKLGGRLRLDEKGRQEIHIPEKFTTERPAVHYTQVSYPDVKIDQHPIACRFPHPPPDDGPAVLPGYDEYIDLMEPDKTLHSLDDFVYSDRSQLSLHCVIFRDATLVILKLPHSAVDVMGFYAFVGNWSRVLAGREDLVQPLADPDKDVVAKIAELDVTATKHPRAEITVAGQKQLAGLGLAIFILRFILLLIFGDKPIVQTLFLPAKTIQILKTQARRDLEADQPDPPTSDTSASSDKDPLFVSESDILAAWTSRVTLSTVSPSSTQDVAIMNIVDMRGRVPEVFGKQPSPDGPVWVQNLVLPSITHLPINTLLSQPLGKTAMQLRTSVRNQATPEAISRNCAYFKPILDQGGMMPVYFKWDSIVFAVSNWHSAKLFETVDFSAAVVADHSREHASGDLPWAKEAQPGKPVSICPVGFSHNPELRNSWGVVGRDAGGNYWLHGMVTRKAWDNVAGELEKLKRLEEEYVPQHSDK